MLSLALLSYFTDTFHYSLLLLHLILVKRPRSDLLPPNCLFSPETLIVLFLFLVKINNYIERQKSEVHSLPEIWYELNKMIQINAWTRHVINFQ